MMGPDCYGPRSQVLGGEQSSIEDLHKMVRSIQIHSYRVPVLRTWYVFYQLSAIHYIESFIRVGHMSPF